MRLSRLTERVAGRGSGVWPATLLWVAAFLFAMATVGLVNDHFGRISPARQIAVYGELPFRDFLDPGYFMTELSSAALQLLLGDNLLGEALLTSAFVAGGTVLVFLLARRLSESSVMALVAAVLALLFLPRAYDYDKVLFYPLGILLCWRYVEAQTASRVWALAAGLVAGGLYRYDTGVFIAAAAVAAMAVVHAGDWRALGRRVGLLGAAVACLALPFLVFLQYNGGLFNAVDQMVTYGRRETARTQIHTPPPFAFRDIVSVVESPSNAVLVRWAASVDEAARRAAEARHGLFEGKLRGAPEERTWAYRIDVPSVSSLRALIEDPDVEDTDGIDRANLRLPPEPFWTRAQRAVPFLRVRLLPGSWHAENANAFLYYLFRLLPLVAAVALILAARPPAQASPAEIARLSSLITVCVALNVFILRDPVSARVGGMAGPAAILSAWLAGRVWRAHTAIARRTLKVVVAVALVLTVWSVSASAEWERMLKPEIARPAHLAGVVRMLAASPPSLDALPNGHLRGIVKYLRECTAPDDRILAAWFVPELYFFAQRGFAAGMVVVFGEHWSEPRFQARSVQVLASQSAPIVIVRTGDESFGGNYPMLVQYLREHYRNAGTTTFGDGQIGKDGYTVFVRRDRVASRTHQATSMPCFW